MDNSTEFALPDVSTQQKTIRKNAFWLFGGQVIGRLLRALVVILPARILSQESWGAFNYILSLVTFLTVLGDLGINALLTREASRDPQRRPGLISSAFVLKLTTTGVLSVIFLIVYSLVAESPEVKALIPAMLFIFIFDSLRDFGASIARSKEEMEKEGLNNILTNLFIMVLGFAFLYFSPSAQSIAIGYALGTGLGLLSIAIALRSEVKKLFTFFDIKLFKYFAVSSWPFGIFGLMGVIMINTDIFMIKWLLSLKDVALYAAPQKIIHLMYLIPGFVSSAFFPALSRNISDKLRLKKLYETSLSTVLLIAAPMVAGSVILANYLLLFIYGRDFVPAGMTFRILALTVAIVAFSTALSGLIYAAGKEKTYLKVAIAAILGNMILDFLFIPVWGIEGSAIATLVNQLVIFVYAFYQARKLCDFNVWRPVFTIAAGVVVMGITTYLMNYVGMHVALNILLSSGAYFSVITLLDYRLISDFMATKSGSGPKG